MQTQNLKQHKIKTKASKIAHKTKSMKKKKEQYITYSLCKIQNHGINRAGFVIKDFYDFQAL